MLTHSTKPQFVQKAAGGTPGLTNSSSIGGLTIALVSFHLCKPWMDSSTGEMDWGEEKQGGGWSVLWVLGLGVKAWPPHHLAVGLQMVVEHF